MARRWARVGKIGTKRLKTGPRLPNFTPRWGRKGARWTPRRARRAQGKATLAPRVQTVAGPVLSDEWNCKRREQFHLSCSKRSDVKEERKCSAF